ncbi:invertebrate-type lysozyme 3-like [Lycorma delicatula]|uniref:invertebrate-type lysozyme 3-like n=1 Tax=Lycorma delicatula TaxID=130591 RepID=UPI003F519395
MRSLAIILIFGFFTEPSVSNEVISDKCVNCICIAISNCNQNLGCDNGACGALRITEPFWIDAYRPVVGDDDPYSTGAYARCAIDKTCATKAEKNYMKRYKTDCNGDGKIECIDFALIHRLGPFGCNGTVDSSYTDAIKNCINSP